MTATDFTTWLDAMKNECRCDQKDCAALLGVDKSQITRWKRSGAPHYVGLAMEFISAREKSGWS
jgi:hypothetical protein